MPITTYSAYAAKVAAPRQTIYHTKNALNTVVGRMFSYWTVSGSSVGVAPTTAVVPTNTTDGSLLQTNSSGVQRVAQISASLAGTAGCLILCDRLSHQGGLSGTNISAQTTNLGTAALTRYTDGVGVFAALEIYTAIGATGTTVTASYTNQAGTAAQVTTATDFGGANYSTVGRLIPLPLQQGDTGVRAVASVTVLATTGTIGNFGVTLFKPLFVMPIPNVGSEQLVFDSILNMGGNMPQIIDNACLFWVLVSNVATTGIIQTAISLIEE